METKPLQKMVTLVLILLVGSLAPSGAALAQSTRDQSSPTKPVAGLRLAEASLQTKAQQTNSPLIPLWLWFALGGLTLWNLLLSYIVWSNFENFDRRTYRNERKIQELESKNIALDHRIDRRNTDIEELTRRVEALNLSSLQSGMLMDLDLEAGEASEPQHVVVQEDSHSSFDLAPDFGPLPLQPISTDLTEPWETIVQNYSHSPEALESYIVERVTETDESLASRRNSGQAPILLKPSANSNYWIFRGEDQNSWLVPKNDLKLTSISYETFQALFDCQEYRPNQKLQIIRPAKVFFNFSTNAWELERKGQVQFLNQTRSD